MVMSLGRDTHERRIGTFSLFGQLVDSSRTARPTAAQADFRRLCTPVCQKARYVPTINPTTKPASTTLPINAAVHHMRILGLLRQCGWRYKSIGAERILTGRVGDFPCPPTTYYAKNSSSLPS
jgi:hypothetical protein